MPGRDGTGPVGEGPMTGWGDGFCVKRVDKDFRVSGNRPGRPTRVSDQRYFMRRGWRFATGEQGVIPYRNPGMSCCGRFRGGRNRF
jgi:hypothetical protein